MSTVKRIALGAIIISTIYACNKGPKVLTPVTKSQSPEKMSSMPSGKPSAPTSFSEGLHTVVVKEILPASRYVYLYVQEGNDKFWIATRKQEVTIGETYYYKGGLLKTNFESKEHQKMFDKIYLVTNLVGKNHALNATSGKPAPTKMKSKGSTTFAVNPKRKIEKTGSVTIAQLVKNAKKYEGKTIQVSGECVKINPNIMGKNWIHLKDGSNDGYDLVVTSKAFVKEGSVVTMKATVALNKDFGAGYKYGLILEEGTLVK